MLAFPIGKQALHLHRAVHQKRSKKDEEMLKMKGKRGLIGLLSRLAGSFSEIRRRVHPEETPRFSGRVEEGKRHFSGGRLGIPSKEGQRRGLCAVSGRGRGTEVRGALSGGAFPRRKMGVTMEMSRAWGRVHDDQSPDVCGLRVEDV
jgi:hypothetical protein